MQLKIFDALVRTIVLCFTLGLLGTGGAAAQTAPTVAGPANLSPEAEATHAALRALRDSLLDAWNRRDMDALAAHLDPNIVVTWQNGEVSRGPEGIRKFYDEIMVGPNRILSDASSRLTVDQLSILHGDDTAIAFGSIHDDFTLDHGITRAAFLGAGNKLSLDSRWTATAVKKDGQWKLASYHVSMDAFSNPILAKAISVAMRTAIIAGIGGVLVGAFLAWLLGRRRTARAGA
jgi:ketosteroid isomerase-like protein